MPVRIGVRLVYKVNMGDYETYDIDYSIEDDAKEGETAKQAHHRVEGLVSELLWAEVAEARKLSTSDGNRARKARNGG